MIVSVPDHCLSFYFVVTLSKSIQTVLALKIIRFLYLLLLSNR